MRRMRREEKKKRLVYWDLLQEIERVITLDISQIPRDLSERTENVHCRIDIPSYPRGPIIILWSRISRP